MTRRQIGAIATIALATLAISLLVVALMPLWLPTLLIRPSLVDGPSNIVMGKVTHEVMKMMFKSTGPAMKAKPLCHGALITGLGSCRLADYGCYSHSVSPNQ